MTRRTSNNSKAIDAFLAAQAEIDTMLEMLVALSAEHFARSPDEINWGHVNTPSNYRDRLLEIAAGAFSEGEHAKCDDPFPSPPADWRAWPRRRARILHAP